jgi:nucleotide-binding universal stress UspA family protein
MTIIAAVTNRKESLNALAEAFAEAKIRGADLVAVNLGSTELDASSFDTDGVEFTVVDRRGLDRNDQGDAVLHEIDARKATHLVVGVRRRTPSGKAILGSLSQHLLLTSPVPVLAVKLPEDELPSSSFDNLPAGMRRVTG